MLKKNVLTIAGADPSGGAGIQRDLKVFHDFGVNGLSVITALTAQNQREVAAILPVSPAFVIKQVKTLLKEYDINVVKLGMLARADIVVSLARLFKQVNFKKIIIDPIVVSSSGYPLLDKYGITALKKQLLPFATIVTPNLHEAVVLSNMKKVSSMEEMKQAAIEIKRLGPKFILVKGGHLKEAGDKGHPPQAEARGKKAVDILYDGREFKTLEAKMINKDVHGTGCILSSAIAACLAKGMQVEEAVKKSKQYTSKTIQQECQI